MSDDSPETADPRPDVTVDVAPLIVALGKILSACDLYGIEHGISRAAIGEGFALLNALLESCKRISFTVADNQLIVNTRSVELKNPLMIRFSERLRTLEIYGFTLNHGMLADEFGRFIALLAARDTKPGTDRFAEALEDGGISHVAASKAVVREIQEDELVVKKDDEDASGSGFDAESVQQIVAFLKGDVDAGADNPLGDLDSAAADTDKLAELIMSSVAVRQRAAGLEDGESLSDLLVGCLRRTFEGMSSRRESRTQKGRKKITQTLVVLEKNILDKLHEVAGDLSPGVEEQFSAGAAVLRDEISVEGIVAEYMKRHQAVAQSEDKIAKLVKSRDMAWAEDVGLKEKMIDCGMGLAGWQKIAAKSGIDTAIAGGEAGSEITSMLALVLGELSELMGNSMAGGGEKVEDRICDALARVGGEVEDAVARTHAKIDALASDVQGATADESDAAVQDRPARENRWALVAEIVQELCQPLTVVNCTIDMLNSDSFSNMPAASKQSLAIAADCSRRMKSLADRLVEICGVPSGLTPVPVGWE